MRVGQTALPANEEIMLLNVSGNAIELSAEFHPSAASSYSSTLPYVRAHIPAAASLFVAEDEPLKLGVFVDRSVVEVVANGRLAAAVRVYPGRQDSIGVSLRSQGRDTVLASLDAWRMANIYR